MLEFEELFPPDPVPEIGWLDGPPPIEPDEWRTRTGTVLKIRDMTTRHILNAMRLLERHHEVRTLADVLDVGRYLAGDPPDGAYDAAMGALDEMLEQTVEERWPVFGRLRAELARRVTAKPTFSPAPLRLAAPVEDWPGEVPAA